MQAGAILLPPVLHKYLPRYSHVCATIQRRICWTVDSLAFAADSSDHCYKSTHLYINIYRYASSSPGYTYSSPPSRRSACFDGRCSSTCKALTGDNYLTASLLRPIDSVLSVQLSRMADLNRPSNLVEFQPYTDMGVFTYCIAGVSILSTSVVFAKT